MTVAIDARRAAWRALLEPESIAVVGASAERFYARNVVERLRTVSSRVRMHLVNPNRETAFGRACVPSLDHVGERVDLAVLVVRAERVVSSLAECAAAGVRAAIVVAAGAVDETDLKRVADEGEMVVLGPSSLGILNAVSGIDVFAGGDYGRPLPGVIGFVSQSGGLLQAAIGEATHRALGFTQMIAAGGGVCTSADEVVEQLVRDDETHVVCAVVEELREPDRFTEAALAAAAVGKPLIVLKLGRSEATGRLAVTHTGAVTGSDDFHDALFADLGVTRVDSLDHMFDAAMWLATAPSRARQLHSTAIVSLSGGVAGVAADLLSTTSVAVPALEGGPFENPLEFGRQLQAEHPEKWGQLLEALAQDERVDSLLVFDLGLDPAKAASLARWRETSGKLAALSENSPGASLRAASDVDLLHACRLPAPLGPVSAARGLHAFARYVDELAPRAAQTAADRRPRRSRAVAGAGTLADEASRELLRELGIAGPAERRVDTPAGAVAAAEALGWPVVVKSAVAVAHRTENGLVRVGMRDPAEVETAAKELLVHGDVLVQELVNGVELFVGVDNTRGHLPLVTVSRGGTLVELESDRMRAIGPIGRTRTRELLEQLAVAAVLHGYRGGAASDIASVVDVVGRLTAFAFDAWNDVAVAEINPLIVRPAGNGAVAVDALIELRERST